LLDEDDPPVDGYIASDTMEDPVPLRRLGPVASTLTGHVLLSMIPPAQPRGGSFTVDVEPTKDWLEEMRTEFDVSQTFADLLVFESPGRLVVIGRNPYDPAPVICMHGLWMGADDPLPECIYRWLHNGGGFCGRFAPVDPLVSAFIGLKS
jgi:hypothetical protein